MTGLLLSTCTQPTDNADTENTAESYPLTTYNPTTEISFRMAAFPETYTFPITESDAGAAQASRFSISETEVTYLLWYTVRTWATGSEYTFANDGTEGSGGTEGAAPVAGGEEPVTHVNWRDAMVWCNALTEWYNAETGDSLSCVYTVDGSSGGTPLRDSSETAACDSVTPYYLNTGFRLPVSEEWEMAAQYRGGDTINTVQETIYGTDFSNPVGGIEANAAGLRDMSGNVIEWCFDLGVSDTRIGRGGDWSHGSADLMIGRESRGMNEIAHIEG